MTPRKPWRYKMSPHLRWFSVGQAAQFTGLEESAIERMLKDGRLPSTVEPGGVQRRRLIPREQLEAVKREMERGLELSVSAPRG